MHAFWEGEKKLIGPGEGKKYIFKKSFITQLGGGGTNFFAASLGSMQ